MIRIVDAESGHWEDVLKIYAPYITDTTITFEYEVPNLEEFIERCESIKRKNPFLVCEIDGKTAGYCYAGPRALREAYKWSFDLSVYISPEYQGRHIGRALYEAVLGILKLMGAYNAYGLVSGYNEQSRLFHEKLGFSKIAVLPSVGFKHGKWLDVTFYHLPLREYVLNPKAPKDINSVRGTPEYKEIISRAEKLIL